MARDNILEEQDRDVEMIGMSPQMIEVYKMITRVASTGTTVLLQGESGSGKEPVRGQSMQTVIEIDSRLSR